MESIIVKRLTILEMEEVRIAAKYPDRFWSRLENVVGRN